MPFLIKRRLYNIKIAKAWTYSWRGEGVGILMIQSTLCFLCMRGFSCIQEVENFFNFLSVGYAYLKCFNFVKHFCLKLAVNIRAFDKEIFCLSKSAMTHWIECFIEYLTARIYTTAQSWNCRRRVPHLIRIFLLEEVHEKFKTINHCAHFFKSYIFLFGLWCWGYISGKNAAQSQN